MMICLKLIICNIIGEQLKKMILLIGNSGLKLNLTDQYLFIFIYFYFPCIHIHIHKIIYIGR